MSTAQRSARCGACAIAPPSEAKPNQSKIKQKKKAQPHFFFFLLSYVAFVPFSLFFLSSFLPLPSLLPPPLHPHFILTGLLSTTSLLLPPFPQRLDGKSISSSSASSNAIAAPVPVRSHECTWVHGCAQVVQVFIGVHICGRGMRMVA